jgi:hypothetical protein
MQHKSTSDEVAMAMTASLRLSGKAPNIELVARRLSVKTFWSRSGLQGGFKSHSAQWM